MKRYVDAWRGTARSRGVVGRGGDGRESHHGATCCGRERCGPGLQIGRGLREYSEARGKEGERARQVKREK